MGFVAFYRFLQYNNQIGNFVEIREKGEYTWKIQ